MDKTAKSKNLLLDDFFKGEMEYLKQIELQKIINSSPQESELREIAYMRINALQSVLSHFESMAASSKIAEKRWKIL